MDRTDSPPGALLVTPDLDALTYRSRVSALTAEVELWRAVNDSLPDLVIQLDGEGRVAYFNRVLDPTALGQYLPDLVPDPEDRARLAVLVRMLLAGEAQDSGFEYVDPRVKAIVASSDGGAAFEYADPSGMTYECRAAPIVHRSKIIGAALVVRDVTAQRRTQDELHAANGQLAQAQKLSAIGQLAAGMAHEINTPIQFVSDNARFLDKSFGKLLSLIEVLVAVAPDDPRVQAALAEARLPRLAQQVPRALEQSIEGLGRVAKIVSAMKAFSHPSNGNKEAVSLLECFETTATVARNEWRYVAELAIDVPEAVPRVPLLRDEFNQALLNLIVNAAHAVAERHPDGASAGRIGLSARQVGDAVECRVSDNGAGIPERVRGQVFDPFFTTKPVGKGTGQGLAIAWSVVVDKHGGTIRFESEVGVGTTFVLRLPLLAND